MLTAFVILGVFGLLALIRWRWAVSAVVQGRWLAIARCLVDLTVGFVVVGAVVGAVFFAFSSDDVSVGGDRMNVSRSGVHVTFEPSVGFGSDATGQLQRAYERVYGQGVEVTGSELEIERGHPGVLAWGVAISTVLVRTVCLLGFLLSLQALLARAAGGEPFHASSVRALRRMAVSIAVFAFVGAIGSQWVIDLLIHTRNGYGGARVEFPWSLGFVAVLLLALAEIWSHGIGLREDVEATV